MNQIDKNNIYIDDRRVHICKRKEKRKEETNKRKPQKTTTQVGLFFKVTSTCHLFFVFFSAVNSFLLYRQHSLADVKQVHARVVVYISLAAKIKFKKNEEEEEEEEKKSGARDGARGSRACKRRSPVKVFFLFLFSSCICPVGSEKKGPRFTCACVSEQGPAIIQDDRFNKRKGRIRFLLGRKRRREKEKKKNTTNKNEERMRERDRR
jgi:hypothetical protein